jgi:hypothetical protein
MLLKDHKNAIRMDRKGRSMVDVFVDRLNPQHSSAVRNHGTRPTTSRANAAIQTIVGRSLSVRVSLWPHA